eukprot:755256-Hanusia_phi.AAC.1
MTVLEFTARSSRPVRKASEELPQLGRHLSRVLHLNLDDCVVFISHALLDLTGVKASCSSLDISHLHLRDPLCVPDM